jgi:molecular chaperone DnaJ
MSLYEVLGVREGATPAEIRRGFQKASRLLHPALNPGDPSAAERFRAVAEAFAILSDPQRRAEYDRGDAVAVRLPEPEVNFAGFDFTAEVHVGQGTIRELFADVLRPPGGGALGDPTRGEDLEQSVRVAFHELFRPAPRRIHLVRYGACPACNGRGALRVTPAPCLECGGAGRIRSRRGRMIFTRPCAACGATGTVGETPCGRCEGEGRTMRSEWLDVEIPVGSAEGAQVRVPGAGNAGRRGGPPGDFVLTVHVEPHPFFRREGADLHCELPVTITEAALGAHVDVPTPEGTVTIEVPAGTQNGQRFRLRKRGLPRAEGGRGDLYVEARVWVPKVSDDESRELLREFARRNPQNPRAERPTPPAAAESR